MSAATAEDIQASYDRHVPRADVPAALRELRRVAQPGGHLLVTFHIGDDTLHL